MLFPGNGTFSKLPGRRMFLLTHNGDEKLFFWCPSCSSLQHESAPNALLVRYPDVQKD